MIELQHITKTYGGFTAVDDINLRVETGENMVFLGRSGCGKTTLLRMINRLIDPDAGEIRIDGELLASDGSGAQKGNGQPSATGGPPTSVRIADLDPAILRRKIGYVMQNTGLFPHYTIAENVAIVPRLRGWEPARILERTRDLLEKLHLPPDKYLTSYPHQLSGGQQQRVGLARALAADPPVLLMDEPFGALDPITRASVKRDFMRLDELVSKTIILVTHDVQEAFELADRICLLDRGRIVQCGPPSELLHQPATDYVRAFFDDQRFLLEAELIDEQDHTALINAFSHFKQHPH